VQDPTRDPVFNIYGGWEPLDQMSVCHCGDEYVIRWAPVPADNFDEHLYQIVVPLTELPLSNADFPNDAELAGTQSYDGVSRPTLGRSRAEGSAFDPESWLHYFMADDLDDIATRYPEDPLRALHGWLMMQSPGSTASRWQVRFGADADFYNVRFLHPFFREALVGRLISLEVQGARDLGGPWTDEIQLPRESWPEPDRSSLPRRHVRFLNAGAPPPTMVLSGPRIGFVDPQYRFFRARMRVDESLEAAWLQIVAGRTSE
ncbi:MAG: hypothetical protein ACFB21_14565, partial [Opitutales bacterium]